jgi:hypothetical protein
MAAFVRKLRPYAGNVLSYEVEMIGKLCAGPALNLYRASRASLILGLGPVARFRLGLAKFAGFRKVLASASQIREL